LSSHFKRSRALNRSWKIYNNNNNNNNRLYSTPDTPQAGVQRHHTGMRGGFFWIFIRKVGTLNDALDGTLISTAQ